MTQSKGYVDPQYLAAVAERLKEAKERSYSLMHVQTGQRVLDVGCGPGTDTLPLAHLVGYICRQLYSMFTQQQLREISVSLVTLFLTQYAVARNLFLLDCREREAVVAGLVTEDDLQRWRASLEQAEADGVFFGSMCGVMVAGRRR